MKQKHRQRALDNLLSQLDNRDFDVREYALFQLALILERSNCKVDAASLPNYYAENLTRDLLRLRLASNELRAVGARLAQLAASNRQSRSSSLWALAKLNADIGFSVLLDLALSVGERFDNDSAIQACAALRDWLAAESETLASPSDTETLTLLLPVLRRWRERDNADLKESAQLVIDLLKAKYGCGESRGHAH